LLGDGAAALSAAASGIGNKRAKDAFEIVTGVGVKSFVFAGYRSVDEVLRNFADAHPLPISGTRIDHFVKQHRAGAIIKFCGLKKFVVGRRAKRFLQTICRWQVGDVT